METFTTEQNVILKILHISEPVRFKLNFELCEYGHDWDEGQYGVKKCKTCRRYKV